MVARTVVATGAGLAGAGVLGGGLAYAISRGCASQIVLPLFFAGGLTLGEPRLSGCAVCHDGYMMAAQCPVKPP